MPDGRRVGRHLVVFTTGATARYDQASERFSAFPTPGKRVGGPVGVAPDGSGGVWIEGKDGLAQLDRATGSWRAVPAELVGRPERYNFGMARGGDGTLWLQRGARIGRFRDGRFDLITPPTPPRRTFGSDLDANLTAAGRARLVRAGAERSRSLRLPGWTRGHDSSRARRRCRRGRRGAERHPGDRACRRKAAGGHTAGRLSDR